MYFLQGSSFLRFDENIRLGKRVKAHNFPVFNDK